MAIEPKFKCCECGFVHDELDDARECCAPRIDEVFPCPICKELHDEEEEAMNCCDAEEASELIKDDGMVFPEGITDTAIYIEAFCKANNLRA